MLNGSSRNEIAYVRMMAGAITKRRKCGRAVVAQKCREHLIEEEQREYNFNGDHVPLR